MGTGRQCDSRGRSVRDRPVTEEVRRTPPRDKTSVGTSRIGQRNGVIQLGFVEPGGQGIIMTSETGRGRPKGIRRMGFTDGSEREQWKALDRILLIPKRRTKRNRSRAFHC